MRFYEDAETELDKAVEYYEEEEFLPFFQIRPHSLNCPAMDANWSRAV